jgi:3-hydroxyisobutyrate dehydrogenase-like beta-hydroxyacid dehydrogenase
MRIAWLGTGIMGAPMARHLAQAGHDVSVWDRSREKALALADDGAQVGDSPQGAVASAEVVVTMVGPCSGRGAPPKGKLVVMASGTPDAVEACMPLFDAVGGKTLRVGEQPMIKGDLPVAFPLKHALKDSNLVLDAAERYGFEAELARVVRDHFARAAEAGHADDDMGMVIAARRASAR